jgi:hypothetical protein
MGGAGKLLVFMEVMGEIVGDVKRWGSTDTGECLLSETVLSNIAQKKGVKRWELTG